MINFIINYYFIKILSENIEIVWKFFNYIRKLTKMTKIAAKYKNIDDSIDHLEKKFNFHQNVKNVCIK